MKYNVYVILLINKFKILCIYLNNKLVKKKIRNFLKYKLDYILYYLNLYINDVMI